VAGAVFISGCTSEPTATTATATATVTTTQPVVTTTTTTASTGQTAATTITPTTTYTTTLTKTAVIENNTTTEANKAEIQKAVTYMFVPEFKPTRDPIPILLAVTNPIDSQWTCDIPIAFTNIDDEAIVVVWMIDVTLDPGETREVLVEGIAMGEGRWKVKVGFKTSTIFTS
jgi:hypothetical protein